MSKRKKPEELDNIERCVAASEAMGFGPHYGDYMAYKETNESEAAAVEALATGEVDEAYAGGKWIRLCKWDGKIVKYPRRDFCCDECRYQWRLAQDRYAREHGLKRAYNRKDQEK